MEKSRTKEKIFADMHRELRVWNPQIPESPERLDPILRILLQLYAHQLSQIDHRIDQVWETATSSLIRSLCPEGVRWPVPAFTVMRCQVTDPAVEVDTHTKFFYKERREGGQTFFFSPLRRERLISAQVRHIYLAVDDTLVDLLPAAEASGLPPSKPRPAFGAGTTYRVYVSISHAGPAIDFERAIIFLLGPPEVLRQLRWGYWYPQTAVGFDESGGFCPGLTTTLGNLFGDDRSDDWGGLRSSADLFKPVEDNFVALPPTFVASWVAGPPEPRLAELMARSGMPAMESDPQFWIRVDLPLGGDKAKFQSSFEVNLNCFVAVNKSELTVFKHTGGNRLIEVELPESIANILEITGVVDSSGREYVAKHRAGEDSAHRYYFPEERGDRLVLWFDFSSQLELPPDSVTVNYAVTAGVGANGIEAGRISELYEHHPGITAAVNVLPTAGAIPAKTDQQVVAEVSSRLRNRDRAVNFSEIARWVSTFDPRIVSVACANGIDRAARGVRRCIVVRATVGERTFYSDDEIKLLQTRLGSFLKSRSSVNTQFRVEIIKG